MNDYAPRHVCYFCNPSEYPPMIEGMTLCARCGALTVSAPNDPMNYAMVVCGRCDQEMEGDVA